MRHHPPLGLWFSGMLRVFLSVLFTLPGSFAQLSFSSSEQDIRSLFEAHGTVDHVNIVTDRDTGQSRGFGFVEMSNNAEGDRAIAAVNGHEVGGRALHVNEAGPKGES